MVDFDAAVAAVQDPNADPVFLAKIAYENPEFGANVVANPRAYPGLKRWVAQFGDERARQQLVAMGWPVPQEGVMRRNTETTPEQAQQSLTQAQYQQPQQASEAQYQMQYQPPAATNTSLDRSWKRRHRIWRATFQRNTSTRMPIQRICRKWPIILRPSRNTISRNMTGSRTRTTPSTPCSRRNRPCRIAVLPRNWP